MLAWMSRRYIDPQIPLGIENLEMEELRERFDAIRQEIKREDDLINQRNTWCILSTTALVTGIIAVARIGMQPEGVKYGGTLAFLLITFSTAGLTLSFYCTRSVTAARKQIEYLFDVYNDNQATFLNSGLFRPFGNLTAHRSGIGYSQATPRIILLVWLILFYISIYLSMEFVDITWDYAIFLFKNTLATWLLGVKGLLQGFGL